MSNKSNVTRIIACAVFKPALDYLGISRKRRRTVRLTYLPTNLHFRPNDLRDRLSEEIANAHQKGERVICLYGDCFPGIDYFCEERGVLKVPGSCCYEMLLGTPRFMQALDKTAGTYFLERCLLENFEEYCAVPLELYDEEVRQCLFQHYQTILYVRQPADPDLTSKAYGLAEFLNLSLEIMDADYSYLERDLIEAICYHITGVGGHNGGSKGTKV